MINENLNLLYGNKIRVRVCGLLSFENKILVVNHSGLNADNEFWHLPGGGLQKGENAVLTLIRECKEECNLDVEIVRFMEMREFIKPPLHAVELYFVLNCSNLNNLRVGFDPELNIIKDVRMMNKQELLEIPTEHKSQFLNNLFCDDRT